MANNAPAATIHRGIPAGTLKLNRRPVSTADPSAIVDSRLNIKRVTAHSVITR
jgi:hypothetical protein